MDPIPRHDPAVEDEPMIAEVGELAPRAAVSRNPRPVAFVLQGGGSLTATQVGMLRALTEAGIRPDFVIGTSAGALNAVMFAVDPTHRGLDRLEALWHKLRRRMVAPLSPGTLTRAVLGRASGLSSNRALRGLLTTYLPIARLDEGVLPAAVVATDMDTGEPVVLRDTPAVASLLASSAFPGLYPPVALAGRILIDGGVAADVPVLQAEALGAAISYVLPCARDLPTVDQRPGLMPLAYRALGQVIEASSRHALAAARSTVYILPAQGSRASHPVDFRDTTRLIEQSYQLGRQELARRDLEHVMSGTGMVGAPL